MQRIRRIPVEVTVWQVDLRILVGWCGGEYVALNYMHRNIETKRTTVKPTNVQCHHSSPNDPLEIELPEYGTINGIRLMMHLTGGDGEASFQPEDFQDQIQTVKVLHLLLQQMIRAASPILTTEGTYRRRHSGLPMKSRVQL